MPVKEHGGAARRIVLAGDEPVIAGGDLHKLFASGADRLFGAPAYLLVISDAVSKACDGAHTVASL
jgi:hypothetical protein